jgi:hypothetical protein
MPKADGLPARCRNDDEQSSSSVAAIASISAFLRAMRAA